MHGGALLSEGTLLLLNLRSDEPARPAATEGLTAADLARRLRPRFQLGLLGWIRGEQVEQNLEALAEIAAQIEARATRSRCSSCGGWSARWSRRCARAASTASVSLKRLLGHADREMRRLYDVGETTYAAAPPVELLNNLLYLRRALAQHADRA